jgi:uncharacterized membrane protein
MLDDPYQSRDVIAVTFADDANAYEALSRLKELDSHNDIGVHGAAVVAREDDGKIVVKDQFGEDNYEGSVGGGLVGLLVGVLGGPLGILIGGATGLLVGSLFDEDEDDETDSALSEISKAIRVGSLGLLADVSERGPETIDAVMAHLNGTVVRRPTADVLTEVSDAEHAQAEAKKKARKELREAKQKKQKEDVDAKLAELKSKLHKQKQATTPTK